MRARPQGRRLAPGSLSWQWLRIHGNTSGLKPTHRAALERLHRRRIPFDRIATPELARAMCALSHDTGRQVGVLVDRTGAVEWVLVGDATKLILPDLGRLRGAVGRFRGLRLVHTHLRGEPLTRDDLVDLTRLRLDLVAAIGVGPEGEPTVVHYGHNAPPAPDGSSEPFRTYGPVPFARLDADPSTLIRSLEAEFARAARLRPVRGPEGRAILVHVSERARADEAEASLNELCELARSAGVEVADTVLQIRDRIDPRFVLGRGKLDEVVVRAMQLDVDVLVFDRDLGPAQAAAISSVTDLKVIDRTQLILDLFAQRARSRDGKLQVELAQMRYLLPRLGTRDDALSRLTGGIGGRGPGETKLEIGRRRARERIAHLTQQLAGSARRRAQQRALRARSDVPVVALVGYTNAGKSTLLNALTGADAYVADALFATLDPCTRRMRLPGGTVALVTDTVGFIRQMPRDLFAAFRATFEEAAAADLLVQVLDASDPALETHVRTTDAVLVELGLEAIPRLRVYNKIDRLEAAWIQARAQAEDAVAVSATHPETLQPLLERIERALERRRRAHLALDSQPSRAPLTPDLSGPREPGLSAPRA
ncbi:MAG: GTPase HflX [Myxococcota bacterium]|nr:GTPase HflX [Myxococcota bacterium]